jgi:hypothetical protein
MARKHKEILYILEVEGRKEELRHQGGLSIDQVQGGTGYKPKR